MYYSLAVHAVFTAVLSLPQSPLEIRRASADPTDVDDTRLSLEFDERNYDANDRESLATDQWASPGSGPTAP